ncbi:epimerase, partial [Halorubrum sp. SS5]
GNHENPFADDDRVTHVEGDRKDETALRAAKLSVEPDVVIDCVAYHPVDVATATDVFADVDGYVYISSGSSYAAE